MKPIPQSTKSPHGRSPERKLPSVRKPELPRASIHRSASSRPPIPRGRSPNMKPRPPHLRKTAHHHARSPMSSRRSRSPMSSRRSRSPMSSRRSRSRSLGHGSPVPLDRVHPSKFVKKRKPFSRSPPPHRLSTPPLHGGRSRNGSMPSEYDVSKKKIRRDAPRMSPGPRSPEKRLHIHADTRIPHRTVGHSDPLYPQERAREYSSAHASSRPSFTAVGHSRGGYSVSSSERSRPRTTTEVPYARSREDYIVEREKHYGPTLHERFGHVISETGRGSDHRIQYSRSDLENITIDVKQGTREHSPTLRHIVNPNDVKLVRRPLEGHRPIFDREEIKHSSRDLRDEPYNEQKLSSNRHYGYNFKDIEKYEITRRKFDTSVGPTLPSERGYTLSEKWQMYNTGKISTTSMDRDERPHGYTHKSRSPIPYPEKSHMRRSLSTDRDFRSERYPSGPEHRPKPDYLDTRRPLPNDPSDLRHSLAVKRKDGTLHDARQRILERRNSGHDRPPSAHGDYRHYPGSSRRPPESSSDRIRDRRSASPPHRMELPRSRADSFLSRERSLERSRPRDDKLSDFPPRSDKYKYPSWMEKSETLSKGSSYYEHENRESSYRGRGIPRGFRPRGPFRGRSFRGSSLRGSGFLRGRGSFRGSSTSRGRGGFIPRRGRRYSPHLWEHDLYDKTLQD